MEQDQIQQLISQLQNGNERHRRAAAYKLGKTKDPIVVPVLISAYTDSDGTVRQNIIDGLKSIGTQEAIEFLATLKKNQLVQTTVLTATVNRRFFNYIIDGIPLAIFSFVIIFPFSRSNLSEYIMSNKWLYYLISYSSIFLYYFLFESLFQRTPGKFITGTKVVMKDGSKPSVGKIALRSITRLVPFDVISLYTGTDPNLKGTWWHDRWNSTRVVTNDVS